MGVEELIDDITESYTVDEIKYAFDRWADQDGWGVNYHYKSSLLAALRGEYDA